MNKYISRICSAFILLAAFIVLGAQIVGLRYVNVLGLDKAIFLMIGVGMVVTGIYTWKGSPVSRRLLWWSMLVLSLCSLVWLCFLSWLVRLGPNIPIWERSPENVWSLVLAISPAILCIGLFIWLTVGQKRNK